MCLNLCCARDVPVMMCVSFVSLDTHSLHCCRALDTLRRDLCTFVFCARYVRMFHIHTRLVHCSDGSRTWCSSASAVGAVSLTNSSIQIVK